MCYISIPTKGADAQFVGINKSYSIDYKAEYWV